MDQTLGSLQQLKQDSSSSSEELKVELENKQSPNSEESREETRHDPVGGTHGMPVNVEPKKGELLVGITFLFFSSVKYLGQFH